STRAGAIRRCRRSPVRSPAPTGQGHASSAWLSDAAHRLKTRPAMARNGDRARAARPDVIRCAVYTRKSSEDGLEQAFNSLHAQREACLAYIASQRHEGWVALPTEYNDGGYSGGNLNRPALQRLLADIRAGHVDLVVIY